jgi:hypothetical protein
MTTIEIAKFSVTNQLKHVLCEEFERGPEVTQSMIDKMCEERNAGFFQEDYVRYFTRVESMGVGFWKPGATHYKDGIDFEKLKKIHSVIQTLPQLARDTLIETMSYVMVRPNLTRPLSFETFTSSCPMNSAKPTLKSDAKSLPVTSR